MAFYEDQGCPSCGVRFGVPRGYTANRREDKKSFFCPNGHSMSYTESEADRLRRERDLLKQRLAQKDDEIRLHIDCRAAAERSAPARKGQITKLKKRAAAGVCPCCNRSFENLRRHMDSQHPGFPAEEVA